MGKVIVKPKKIEWSEEMINELYKASKDPKYFANEYVQIIHPKHGRIKLNLRDYQERVFDSIIENDKSVLLASRQIGKCCVDNTLCEFCTKDGKTFKMTIGDFFKTIKKEL